MQTRKFLTLILFYFLIVNGFGAAPVVQILTPNGGENIYGTYPITFSLSDADSDDLNIYRLYYSATAGGKNYLIDKDINLMAGYCNFVVEGTWSNYLDINAGLSGTFPDGNYVGQMAVFDYLEKTNLVYVTHTGAANPAMRGYTWNTSTSQWDDNSTFWEGGYNAKNATVHGTEGLISTLIFEKDSSLYMLSSSKQNIFGFKWNVTNKVWDFDNDINSGITVPSHNAESWFMGHWLSNGIHYFVNSTNVFGWGGNFGFNGYNWNGTQWVANASASNNLKRKAGYHDKINVFQEAGGAIHLVASSGATKFLWDYYWTGTGWSDTNTYFSTNATFVQNSSAFNLGGTIYGSASNYTGTVGYKGMRNANKFNTSNTKTCTYNWDTTSVISGDWFIDLNVIDTTSSTGQDSSDAFFTVNNLTLDGNLVFTAIKNVAGSIGYSVNVNPTVDSNDFIYKLENQGGDSTDFNTVTLNELDDGWQYKVFTADSTDYGNGVWNLDTDLTYGSNNLNSIQKIWDSINERYEYTFNDTLIGEEVKYYKLDYYKPAYHTNSVLDDPNWDNFLTPNRSDLNATSIDLFSTSVYSNLKSILTSLYAPDINSNLTNTNINYVFSVTTKAGEAGNGTFIIGKAQDLNATESSTYTSQTTTNFRTVNYKFFDGYPFVQSASTGFKEIWAHNYVVTERGYFVKNLDLYASNGDELPVFLDSGNSIQYISEGKNFIVDTQYYDPESKIDRIEVSMFIDGVADENRLKKWVFDAEAGDEDDFITFRETVGGAIDLTTNAGNRNVKVTVKLIDTNVNQYEIQSELIKFVQFPYFPNDFAINSFIFNTKVGEHPEGMITLRTVAPETLRGVKLYIYQAQTGAPDNTDYNTVYYKDVDFDCRGFDCSFDFKIDDWVFEASNDAYKITVSALLSTQAEDYNSLITAKTHYFGVPYRTYETLRIFETVERTDHNYSAEEEIPLVIQVRDSDYANLKNDLEVMITPYSCVGGITGTCTSLDVNYLAESFIYDKATGYNYWFFKELFVKSTGTILDVPTELRILGTLTDKRSKHQATKYPLLAPKCDTYDLTCNLLAVPADLNCFYASALSSLNEFAFGCQKTTSPLVTTTDNNSQEILIGIETKTPTPPLQTCAFCINADTNNVYVDELKQEFLCGAWYKLNEAPIDYFRIYVTNKHSDLAKTGSDAQYAKIEMPYELIAFNDIILMQQALNVNYQTKANTIGELIQRAVSDLLPAFLNPMGDALEDFTDAGLIPNLGVDCNFSKPIDPEYLNGLIFYKVKGLKVINQFDYVGTYPELAEVDPADFLEYMNYYGNEYPENTTNVEFFASAMNKVYEKEIATPLVINVDTSTTGIKKENIEGDVDFDTLPKLLKFQIISDLVYNNEQGVIRRYVPFTITMVLGGGVGLFSTLGRMLISNWFIIFIALVLLYFGSRVFRNVKGNG